MYVAAMRTLEGQTALVTGGGRPLGRAIALALAARGVRVVVTGVDEKALGITVGEIVHGGGKARHLAGDPADAAHLTAAVERALEVFGGLDIVIATDPMSVDYMFSIALQRMPERGRLFVAGATATTNAGDRVRAVARDVAARGMTCNAIVAPEAATDRDTDDEITTSAAELVVFLCSHAGGAVTGQVIAVGHLPASAQ
jgi:enoyl-[acyl-carrier-protein] reductase (NADH)